MLNSEMNVINHDVKILVKDAQALFKAASTLTGEKADEARSRGMRMLDTAMEMTHAMQANALTAGKEMAHSADAYVKQNPWMAFAGAAGIGLIAGVLLARK